MAVSRRNGRTDHSHGVVAGPSLLLGGAVRPPESVQSLLYTHYERWTRAPRALSLDWGHYASACPPLLVIGGSGIQPCGSPLIVVSIEPLTSYHFETQADFASRSFEHYTGWTWGYFDVFPRLVNGRVQQYWGNLAAFAAGFSGLEIDRRDPWEHFGSVLVELPYVPMHASSHRAAAWRGARQALRDLFVTRVDILSEIWPQATFVVLTAGVRHELEHAGLLEELTQLDLDTTTREGTTYGRGFATPMASGRLATRTRPRVVVRSGPFSRYTNPREEGRRELGRRVAALR